MRNKTKKILSFLAAATMLTSTLALSACGGNYSLDTPLDYTESNEDAESNGGFAVTKDDYVYFINGVEEYTADNTYGDVVKGSLMRIKKEALTGDSADYASAEVVVPMLVGSQNFETGIYIYGDYVYYAAPTTDKNLKGQVENSWIDFKRAKLDGSKTMGGYFFRLSTNNANFRFVKEGDTVYCLYEEDGALKSYNTETRKTTVLVKGASAYYFDETDPEEANVYYTMGVTYDWESSSKAAYNQIYSVNASATVEKVTNGSKEVSYKVKDGREYTFDKDYLKEQNEAAKEAAKEAGEKYKATYVFDDYTTYPYVNLGTLVLDGIGVGVGEDEEFVITQYNDAYHDGTSREEVRADAASDALTGYTYTIQRYENDGVYYTKANDKKLYYLSEDARNASGMNAIKANSVKETVALDTTKASASALFEYEGGVHQYIYLSEDDYKIHRVTTYNAADKAVDENVTLGDVKEEVKLCNAAGMELWKTEGDYLYYYGSGTTVTGSSTSGKQLHRINYKGDADNYDKILNENYSAEYRPITLTYVDFNDSWYMPEIIDVDGDEKADVLLYSNAQAIGSTSYNYIYATNLGTDEIEDKNAEYEKTLNYIEEDFTIDISNAATYLFRTYGTNDWFEEDYEAVKAEYLAKNEKDISWKDEFEGDNENTEVPMQLLMNGTYKVESYFINMIGSYTEDDEEAIRETWKDYLPFEVEEEEEDKGLAWWAITLIVVGSVLVAGAAVGVPLVILYKRKLKKAEEEATVNAYKRSKIDTTDDKSIDVYADEDAQAPVEETAVEEAPVEEAPASENE